MIRVQNLRKSFGSLTAVNDVSFEVAAGEAFGLLGPNGAGKTTTLNMFIGALAPDSGTIEIAGRRDPRRVEVRREVGVAPQALAIYEELSAAENLAFFGRLYDLSGARLRERVDWGLEFAGLTDRRGDRAGKFSGGMKRRLNLACALVHEPRVLLLDEPTVGVDPQSRNHIFESIEKLRSAGCTLVYTTHYMEEATRLCDRIAIMDRGRILAMDTVDRLIAAHGGKSVINAELERPPDDPARLPAPLDGLHLRYDTDKPLDELARLATSGMRFATLRIDQPDLETVFLTLTGRRLRD